MKKIIIASIAAMLMAGQIGLALASLDGNPRKGKYLFRKTCRPCHMENSEKAVEAGYAANPGYLGPDSKRQAQWLETFEGKEELPCFSHWQDLSESDMNDILIYLHDGAKDSPTPQKCG
ncbi:MAG: c-type cytochrome [Desulfonatronovibrionaceae bacterium]